MLYADDIMHFLGDIRASLVGVMSIILDFGHYSGLTINWTKSALVVLDKELGVTLPDSCPVPIVSSFHYLGIQISPRIIDYGQRNINPYLT